jgi:hypothetical protein
VVGQQLDRPCDSSEEHEDNRRDIALAFNPAVGSDERQYCSRGSTSRSDRLSLRLTASPLGRRWRLGNRVISLMTTIEA